VSSRVALPVLMVVDLRRRREGQSAESEVSPKVGLLFRTTEWLTIWGSYAEAFLAPGLTEQSAEGLHFRGIRGVFPDNFFVPNPDSKPETTGRACARVSTIS
jgi:outer membrane receptor protein involved in Fe transport